MKDNFSKQANLYSKFRPDYPISLIEQIVDFVKVKSLAWDCATGNGQIAKMLSPHFQQVIGTDISQKQIEKAMPIANVEYKLGNAEKTGFEDQSVDLITVGQAIHWFDHEKFNREVFRILKPNGVIAILGYPLLTVSEPLQSRLNHFYKKIVGPYWDEERKHIDERWARIPFPFERIELPQFEQKYNWTFDQFIGYLSTWSACQHYEKDTGRNPVEYFKKELKSAWGDKEKLEVIFEIMTMVGRVEKP